ncbi:Rid family detoxifying hydrolase [Arthrobacter sp. CAN_C5]|uniref:Rid family detoxifying hydrolase n=1 Tax=Arthrobacter sp. CAN_C5 TaxID=2760706 RepID=UPI001AE749CA|nr:Rid family detoxifying hydrolase [Arthrobacter sp. CAN_C5]MBP2217033.1 2-iminobutanoate/2-iminopropanoate deaminase [Arthrobacter sp. CAN_C5]
MSRRTIDAANAPDAIGPYSHAATAPGAGLLYLSGQTPIDPRTGQLVDGDIKKQTRQVFANLEAVLTAAHRTPADVIKVNVYLISMADFAAVNDIYAEVFESPYPARTTVAVAELPRGARVEIEAIAAQDQAPQ